LPKPALSSAKKTAGLFPEAESQPDSTSLNAAEEAERKKAIARQDKHLLDEASNAQWQKL
jgi:hypothetical protein